MRSDSFGARLRAPLRGTPIHTGWRWVASAIGARRARHELAGVRTLCLFIGHPRSGHSIVGALLDAHPQVVISDELDAVRYLDLGFGPHQVLYLSVAVARHQAENQRRKAGSGGRTYSYHVPGQWQGRTRDLRVVGDSQAGWTVRRFRTKPGLRERIEAAVVPIEIRYIHVTRNPYDNIATMMERGGRTFDDAFERYFINCRAIVGLAEQIGEDRLLRIRHEDVILDPRTTLDRACRFLGVEADEAYLAACAGILFSRPSRSRSKVEWSDDQRARVDRGIAEFPFLAGYSFDS